MSGYASSTKLLAFENAVLDCAGALDDLESQLEGRFPALVLAFARAIRTGEVLNALIEARECTSEEVRGPLSIVERETPGRKRGY